MQLLASYLRCKRIISKEADLDFSLHTTTGILLWKSPSTLTKRSAVMKIKQLEKLKHTVVILYWWVLYCE